MPDKGDDIVEALRELEAYVLNLDISDDLKAAVKQRVNEFIDAVDDIDYESSLNDRGEVAYLHGKLWDLVELIEGSE